MWRSVGQRSRSGRSVAMTRFRVHSGSLVLHVGDEAALVVCPVGHDLDPPVRESHAVLSGHHTVLVLDLLLGEVSPGVGVLQRSN